MAMPARRCFPDRGKAHTYIGEATLGDLKPKLQCKRNPEHETLIFATAPDKR